MSRDREEPIRRVTRDLAKPINRKTFERSITQRNNVKRLSKSLLAGNALIEEELT